MKPSDTILVVGSNGQIGTELVADLRQQLGEDRVVAADLSFASCVNTNGPTEILDVLDGNRLQEIVSKYKVTQVFHLAALLSATMEKKPKLGWRINMDGLFNVLDVARERGIGRVFWPSSIAVFGPTTPRDNTPQDTIMDPSTVYGISKLAGERWCEYYFLKYGLDVRSIRYPGLIGHKSEPGGGTTDYAVHIFHQALKTHAYQCFLNEDTMLPMMYMPDAIRATLQLMDAPSASVKIRSAYNLAGISFAPKHIAAEIKKRIPDFQMSYAPDFRQPIADSWPRSIDDSRAQADWGWKPEFDLAKMAEDMLRNIKKKQAEAALQL